MVGSLAQKGVDPIAVGACFGHERLDLAGSCFSQSGLGGAVSDRSQGSGTCFDPKGLDLTMADRPGRLDAESGSSQSESSSANGSS